VIPGQVDHEHAGLGHQVGIELDPAEGGGWRIQRRLGQAEVGNIEPRLGRQIERGPGKGQVVGQVEVLDVVGRRGGHRPS
jgi:hypothetical protein